MPNFNNAPTDKSEASSAETVPEDLMDLDFTGQKPEARAAEAAQAEKDEAEIAATRAALEGIYNWDDPNQHRAGFN